MNINYLKNKNYEIKSVYISLNWRWEIIWKLITFSCEFSLHDNTVNIFKIWNFFKSIIFSIIF
jgi:hypothetical protein